MAAGAGHSGQGDSRRGRPEKESEKDRQGQRPPARDRPTQRQPSQDPGTPRQGIARAEGHESPAATGARSTGRLEKWLWQARFFRSRSLAAAAIGSGKLRVNASRVTKPAAAVGPGDTLTFVQAGRVRVIRILSLATRRGPATEARTLYDDLSAPEDGPIADDGGSDPV